MQLKRENKIYVSYTDSKSVEEGVELQMRVGVAVEDAARSDIKFSTTTLSI